MGFTHSMTIDHSSISLMLWYMYVYLNLKYTINIKWTYHAAQNRVIDMGVHVCFASAPSLNYVLC